VYAILNHPSSATVPLEHRLRAWAAAGVRFVQLRTKNASREQRLQEVRFLAPIADSLDVSLVINDDVEVATTPIDGIWGVHLGQDDYHASRQSSAGRAALRELRALGRGLGLSTHTLAQVETAALDAPDYIGFGPVFPTETKSDSAEVTGTKTLERACAQFRGPVVAIGGITDTRAPKIRAAGAAAIAAIAALEGTTSHACEARARALIRAWEHQNETLDPCGGNISSA
jgi:thiamine-phosphate diphosphorylase